MAVHDRTRPCMTESYLPPRGVRITSPFPFTARLAPPSPHFVLDILSILLPACDPAHAYLSEPFGFPRFTKRHDRKGGTAFSPANVSAASFFVPFPRVLSLVSLVIGCYLCVLIAHFRGSVNRLSYPHVQISDCSPESDISPLCRPNHRFYSTYLNTVKPSTSCFKVLRAAFFRYGVLWQ